METEAAILVHIHRCLQGMEIRWYSLPRLLSFTTIFFSIICCVLYISVKPSMKYTYHTDNEHTVILKQFFCSVPKNIHLLYVSLSGVIIL